MLQQLRERNRNSKFSGAGRRKQLSRKASFKTAKLSGAAGVETSAKQSEERNRAAHGGLDLTCATSTETTTERFAELVL